MLLHSLLFHLAMLHLPIAYELMSDESLCCCSFSVLFSGEPLRILELYIRWTGLMPTLYYS